MDKDNYREYLRSDHWKQVRNQQLEKYDNRCAVCGSRDNLHVHHIDYSNLGREGNPDLIVLCESCHRTIHGFQGYKFKTTDEMTEKIIDSYIQNVIPLIEEQKQKVADEVADIIMTMPIMKKNRNKPHVVKAVLSMVNGYDQIESIPRYMHIAKSHGAKVEMLHAMTMKALKERQHE